MEILEVKRTLDGAVQTFRCTAAEVTPQRAVLLYTLPERRRIADVELPAGTVTVAYYWADRPYNVYHWVAPSGETLAWYVNASGPVQIGDGRVEWEDLEVDVLVTPGLAVQVLDEDRLPGHLPASRLAQIATARRRILDEYVAVTREVEVSSRGFLPRPARER
jgi:predicted RNA-binding protein associated with RNAse of E/G family